MLATCCRSTLNRLFPEADSARLDTEKKGGHVSAPFDLMSRLRCGVSDRLPVTDGAPAGLLVKPEAIGLKTFRMNIFLYFKEIQFVRTVFQFLRSLSFLTFGLFFIYFQFLSTEPPESVLWIIYVVLLLSADL